MILRLAAHKAAQVFIALLGEERKTEDIYKHDHFFGDCLGLGICCDDNAGCGGVNRCLVLFDNSRAQRLQ